MDRKWPPIRKTTTRNHRETGKLTRHKHGSSPDRVQPLRPDGVRIIQRHTKVYFGQVCATQIGASQVGPAQISPVQISAAQIGTAQVHAEKIRATQIRPVKIGLPALAVRLNDASARDPRHASSEENASNSEETGNTAHHSMPYNSSAMLASTPVNPEPDRRRVALFCVGIGLAGLAYLYFRLNVIYSARYPLVTWHHRPAWVEVLYAIRWPMRIVAASALLLLAWLEYCGKFLSIALQRVLQQRRLTTLTVLLLGAVSGSYYLQPGSTTATADGRNYLAWAALLRDYLRSAQVPLWTNVAALGIPFGQFYNWLSYAPAALVGFLVPDMLVATRLALYALHGLAVWGTYLYIEILTGSRAAGLTSAFAHGFAFYLYHKLVLVGLLPVALPVFLLPWQFYYAECIVRQERFRRAWALAALTTALSIAGHLAYGLAAAGLLFFNLLVRGLFPTGIKSAFRLIRMLLFALAVPVTGILAAGLFVVPPLTEANSPIVGFIQRQGFALDLVRLNQVFTFAGSYLTPSMWGGYVGISVSILAAIGAALSIYRRRHEHFGLIAMALIALWLVLGPYYVPFFQSLHRALPFGSVVYGMHTPGYYIIYLGFSLAALSGVAVPGLAGEHSVRRLLKSAQRRSARHSLRTDPYVILCALAMLAMAFDLAPLTLLVNAFEPPAHARQQTGRERVIAWLQSHGDSALRVFEPDNRSLLDIYQHTGLQQTAGIWDDRAPSAVFVEAIAGQEMLYLANVGYVITRDSLPAEQQSIPGLSHLLINPSHTVVLASPRTEVVEHISAAHIPVGIDQSRNAAETIYITKPSGEGNRRTGKAPLEAKAISYNWGLQTTDITYELTDAAFVQVSLSYFPHQSVLLDGKVVHAVPTGLGLIGFWSDAGRHQVQIMPRLSPARLRWGTISITITIALTLAALLTTRNRRVKSTRSYTERIT